jgi:hypothetical protein
VSSPLEQHRPRDLNADDPFVSVHCATLAMTPVQIGSTYSCVDGSVPLARLDLARGLAFGRPHELAVCDSRRYLFDHMDDSARNAFAAAFAECGIHR